MKFVATAFLFGHPAAQPKTKRRSHWTFVVTNRHVVDKGRQLWVRFRAPPNQPAKPFPIPGHAPAPCPWILHPDPNVDLAILPLDAIDMPPDSAPKTVLTLAHHGIARDELRSSECNEGNEVFILGFPLGIAGISQNDVIVRHGILARIQDWYDGRSTHFLIDSSIYPGNSGGPVVLKPVLWSATNKPRLATPRLLGLVASYLPYQDVATSQQTGRVRLVSEENSGLATVVPTDAIVELTSIIANTFDEADGKAVTWQTIDAAVNAASHLH